MVRDFGNDCALRGLQQGDGGKEDGRKEDGRKEDGRKEDGRRNGNLKVAAT